MNTSARAVELFNKGYSCSQAVLAAFSDGSDITQETAFRVACGFGAGCARLGQTCGAVSGAYMAIGLKYGKARIDDNAAREKTYSLVQEFSRQFIARNGSVNCTELLGCNLGTPEGFEKAARTGVISTICPRMVKDAAEILDGILG
jgi:C_GCAxxG_C_C family probable redox protein